MNITKRDYTCLKCNGEIKEMHGLFCPEQKRALMPRPRIDWHIGNLEGLKREFEKKGMPDVAINIDHIQTLLETYRKKALKKSAKPATKTLNGFTMYWSDALDDYVSIPEE